MKTSVSSTRHQIAAMLAAFTVGTLMAGPAFADGNKRSVRVTPLPAYTQECASCHNAFPPGMLPASSWQHLMGNLTKHYGTDASLDAATTQQLTTWLTANAGTYKRVAAAPPEDRITRSAWFIRKHDEVSAATWKLASVKSAANCAACHPKSEQGDFNERDIRIPK